MLTPREAMQQAIERAQVGDYEGGHVWTSIARELRLGTLPVSMSGQGKGYEPEPDRCCEHCTQRCDGTQCRCHGEPVEVATLDGGTHLVPVPAPEPAYRRAETEVLQRVQTEATPAYEAAGESLGETRSIPTSTAHPQADSVGPRSTCIGCELDVLWIVGRGWVHDVEGHPAGCEHAAEVLRRA